MNLREIIDIEPVRDFRRLFYELTGMFTSLYFPEWNKGQVDMIPRAGTLPYCRLIQSTPEGLARCQESDRAVAEQARERRTPHIDTCFAGLTNVQVPIFFQDRFLGLVFAGDVLLRPPSRRRFAGLYRSLSDLPLDRAELEAAYRAVPVRDRAGLRVAARLLSVMVSYIVDREQVITLQERVYEQQKAVADAMSARLELERSFAERLAAVEAARREIVTGPPPALALLPPGVDPRALGHSVRRALRLIDTCYSEALTLADLARHAGLSPNYLSALFHRECGCTFAAYLARKRISRACELLQGGATVSEAGAAVGYQDPSQFSRLFKRLVGLPPGRYRDAAPLR